MSSPSAVGHASTPESTQPPRAPQRLGLALTVISAAQLMVVLDGTIVNIALPHLQTDLGFTP
ncbi:MAG: MFS transporter, partial [Pedococcus sp.]